MNETFIFRFMVFSCIISSAPFSVFCVFASFHFRIRFRFRFGYYYYFWFRLVRIWTPGTSIQQMPFENIKHTYFVYVLMHRREANN